MQRLAATGGRFLFVTGACFAVTSALPGSVLLIPAWIAALALSVLNECRFAFPALQDHGASFQLAGREPVSLQDPYLLAGIPLYLGLWLARVRTLWGVRWKRLLWGLLALKLLGGVVFALVATVVLHEWQETPQRELGELLALGSVGAIRLAPVLLWFALYPMDRRRTSGRMDARGAKAMRALTKRTGKLG